MVHKSKETERRRGWYPVGYKYQSKKHKDPVLIQETFDLKYGGMTFSDIQNRMHEIQSEYGHQFDDFRVEVATEWECGDEVTTVKVSGLRDENDAEYKERQTLQRERDSAREEAERLEYERLAAKFGKQD